MIRAFLSCDNDHNGPVIEFDAAKWFEKASDAEIQELRDEGYSCGYASDSVAEYMDDHDDLVSEFFQYLRFRQEHSRGSSDGYSVRVGDRDAEAWIAEHRPHIAAKAITLLTPNNR